MEKISFFVLQPDGPAKKHEYTLGLGPCGKVVKSLRNWTDGSWLIIHQEHDDGTLKEFTYPAHLIVSKVTAE